MRITRPLVVALLILVLPLGILRAGEHFKATLTGSQEIPPDNSKATGKAQFHYDGAQLDFDVHIQNAFGFTQGHIHCISNSGTQKGPVMVYLLGFNQFGVDLNNNHVSGTLTDTSVVSCDATQNLCCLDAQGNNSSITTLADVVTQMRIGNAYAEFHSIVYPFAVRPGYPPGEIRGQIN
jgi:hypothetical protein